MAPISEGQHLSQLTKIGYEIPLNRHFHVYEPPRPLDEIEADLKALEQEIAGLLSDVVRS